MKFISLFAGVGGFDLALERLGHECVYANEWDKYAVQTYEKNFRRKPDTRDIAIIPEREIPNHELLVGGFPCQAFSIAGKRRGFDDTRGTLFFEIARILSAKKPRLLLLENVKGLLSHDNGRTFKTIIATLTDLGYDLQWQVLNSKNFGVPQNRERVFIVGHTRGTPRPKVFPIGREGEKNNEYKSDISSALDANYWKGPSKGFGGKARQLIRTDEENTRQEGHKSHNSNAIRRIPYSNGMRIRRLTPLECERLQGFPDNWTAGVSDTQRYKQMGNAITVNVVYEIAKHLGF